MDEIAHLCSRGTELQQHLCYKKHATICAIETFGSFMSLMLFKHISVFFCFTVCGWVAVHPDCWCICVCYLHFAPENIEDGKIYLLVPAYLGCPRQSPESCKMVVCKCVYGGCFYVFLAFQYYICLMSFFLDNLGKPTPEG